MAEPIKINKFCKICEKQTYQMVMALVTLCEQCNNRIDDDAEDLIEDKGE